MRFSQNILDIAAAFARLEQGRGISDDVAFKLMVGEVGELSRAMAHEDGDQVKDDVQELSPGEAFDVAISALALFFRRGGTVEEFDRLVSVKGGKWAENLGTTLQAVLESQA